MSTTEAGVAYTRLLPSMQGFSSEVSKGLKGSLKGPFSKAGDEAGGHLSDGISKGLSGQSGKLKGAASKVGDIFKVGLAGAGIAGAALLTAGLSSALDAEAAQDKLVAQLGGGEWAEETAKVAGNLYGQAFGESVADTADAVKQVLQSGILEEDELDTKTIEKLTAQALTFSDVLDQDLGMSLQAVDRMLSSGLAGSAEEAFDVLTKGIQSGADRSGDLTETFQEYSTIFREIGLSAQDATGLMSLGLNAGARDADTVADALKEFAIRGQDASDLSAKGFAAIGLSAEEMTAKVAAGGPQARDALDQVLKGLQGMEDPAERNAAAVALFGTKAEDLGDALFNLDLGRAGMLMEDSAGAAEGLGSAYDNAKTRIESFKRQALMKLTSFIGGQVIPAGERLAEVVGPVLGAAFGGLRDLIGRINFDRLAAMWGVFTDALSGDTSFDFAGQMGAVQDFGARLGEFVGFVTGTIVPGIQAALAGLAELWAQHGASVMSILGQLATIVGDVFALVVVLIERGVQVATFIWTNFGDEILAVASIAWGLVGGIVKGALDIIQGIIRTATAILRGDWSGAWEGIKQIFSGVWTVIKTILVAALESIKLAVLVGFRIVKAYITEQINAAKLVVKTAIDGVAGFFEKLPGRIKSGLRTLASTITEPFRKAFSSLKSLWNDTVGGFGFSIPDWVPKVGGKSFKVPKMHGGGIVPGAAGTEHLRVLEGGEGVFSRDQLAAIGSSGQAQPAPPPVIELVAAGESRYVDWLEHIVRVRGGGSVQRAFGEAA